jgi:hypothetical protein
MVKSKQIIGGYEIPVAESLSLTKAAFSVDNPQIRKTDFSKSINVPANEETNKLFENLFQVNVALQTFNPNLKETYELIIDGISVLRGYCQLKEITITDNLTYYVLNASGMIGDLFRAIGESELSDIDFSDLNHTWNETNVENSWSATIGEGYVYPMIRNGQVADELSWDLKDFKPAVYVKEIVDRIFEDAGFSYDSDFFTSDRFKRLIVPATETPTLTDSQIEDLQFFVQRDDSVFGSDQTGIGCSQFNTANMDILIFNKATGDYYNTSGNDYNLTTGRFTSPNKLRYVAKGQFTMKVTFDSMSASYASWFTAILNGANAPIIVKIHIVKNGTTIIDTIEVNIVSVLSGETITSPNYTSAAFSFSFTSAEFTADTSDVIDFRMGAVELNVSNYYTYYLTTFVNYTLVKGSQAMFEIINPQILEGGTMSIDATIPKKVKQKDFLNALIKRFNLFMQFDDIDDKKLIIEPLDEFVTAEKESLQDLVDNSRQKRIIPMGALKDGSFIFRDKEDKDIFNENYQSRKPNTYGYKEYDIENDFLLSEKVIETIFAPTVLTSYSVNDRILSDIQFPLDEFGKTDESALPRLLYYGGLLDTANSWFFNSQVTPKTQYPYAGHLDDPYDPSFDLSWSVPRLLYFKTGNVIKYTDKNCFNIYWKKYIEQIASKDAKLLEVYLAIDSHRYNLLSFRKQYWIDGAYWRLLEVQDFDPINPKTTKCLFIQLPEVASFTGETKVIYGGDGEFSSGDESPQSAYVIPKGGGSHSTQSLVFGSGVIAGQDAIHNSNNVFSGSGNKQVFSSGSDGAIMVASKSAAINSPNGNTFRVNDTIIAGIPSLKRLELTLSASDMKNLNTFPIPLSIGVDTDEYIRIEKGFVKVGATAFTNSQALVVRTVTSNTTLSQSESTAFATVNYKGLMNISAESLDFGEDLELYQSSDMTGTGSDCTIILFYQIIKV